MSMSTSSVQSVPAQPSAQVKSASPARRDNACTPSQGESSAEQRDAFELALRAKSSRRDEGDEQQDPDSDAAASALAAALATGPHAMRQATPAASASHSASETVSTGPRAAIEAALNANSGPIVTPLGATDPAALWEASISEPNAIPVDVRMMRAERSAAQDAQPNWTVAVSSSTVNADVLARHAPRLNERLRKQGLGFSHVRIEGQQENDE